MTPVAVVTGSGGLIGSACVSLLVEEGFDVVGIENDMRARFFGPDASSDHVTKSLLAAYPAFRSHDVDVRDAQAIERIFAEHGARIEMVVHAAAQPSHDWAASDPETDFAVNAGGTLHLLEAARRHAPDATFVFTSTNKVYGDGPNGLPLAELGRRLDLPAGHRYYDGIDTTMSIDRTTHSLFGVSKAAADLMVQEYGRYFGMPTVSLRCGCVTGANHAGAMLHGFLSYLMRCTVAGEPYTVFGYGGKQVRDNVSGIDVARAALEFHRRPRAGAVYNLGGGRDGSCSVLEAIALCERIAGRELAWRLVERPRAGDHRWWITDVSELQRDYPGWRPAYGVEAMLMEIFEQNADRWEGRAAPAAPSGEAPV